MSDVSVEWDGLPNWISAVAAVLALIAAAAAGLYARSAARATHQQAIAAEGALQIAREDLRITKKEAKRARDEADRQRDWSLKTQFDALVPSVFAVAHLIKASDREGSPGPHLLSLRELLPSIDSDTGLFGTTMRWTEWGPMLDERLIIDIEGNRRYQFRYSVKIEVTNLTPDRLVQLAVVGYARGVTSVKEGAFEAILPGQKATFLWTREVDSEFLFQMKEFELGYFLFDMRPMVNDNGFNVEDYYVFHEELRFFEAHGSQIIVYPEPIPPNTWGSGVVAPLRSDERVYTRLLRKRV